MQFAELLERLDLDAIEVAVGDEQDEVGVAHGLFGKLAAQFAGRLVDARRIDQHELGVLEPGLGHRVGRAVLRRDGENRLPGERVEQRALARPDLAERRDLDAAVLELSGESLDVVHFLFDCRALGRPQPLVLGELAQRFDGVGQQRLILHEATRLPSRGFEAQQPPGARRKTLVNRLVSARMSLAGRRSSTRTAPRASSIWRSTGLGAPATETTGPGATGPAFWRGSHTRIASRSAAVNWSALARTT